MNLSGADFIVEYFASHQVKYAFLVPGYYIDPLLESLINYDVIKPIICNSELGSGYIADGYARASKNIALCLSTAGGAVTNLMTAVFNAKEDEIPVFFITGNVPNNLINSGGFQALNSQQLFTNLVKYSAEISDPAILNKQLNNAIFELKSQPLSPVHLSIPLDIQNHDYQSSPVIPKIESFITEKELTIIDSTAEKISHILNQYSKICVLAGQRLKQENRPSILLQFAEKFNLPIATTLAGKGIFSETHPLSLGTFTISGHLRAKQALLHEDMEILLLIGLDFNQQESLGWFPELFPKQRQLIRLDHHSAKCQSHVNINEDFVVANCSLVLNKIINCSDLFNQKVDSRLKWVKELQSTPLYSIDQENNELENNPIPLNLLIQKLQAKFPPHTILCTDAGFCRRFASSAWLVREIDNFYSATNLAPMGWAIGAGIGIKLAKPEHPVIVLTGDGSMAMHGVDLITAIRYQLPIFYVISNNQGYGTIYQRVHNQPSLAKQMLLPPINWVNFAQSLGINAVKLKSLSELDTIIEQFLTLNSTFLLEVDTNLIY
jgi:acetolactate synthase-1/2/3 large subunit